jgi:hypothetical protein
MNCAAWASVGFAYRLEFWQRNSNVAEAVTSEAGLADTMCWRRTYTWLCDCLALGCSEIMRVRQHVLSASTHELFEQRKVQ